MNKLYCVFLLIVSTVICANSQSYQLDDFPTTYTEKRAKSETKNSIDSLAVLLKFTKKERKIRKFQLSFCLDRPKNETDGLHFTPAGDFPSVQGCPGFYTYQFKSSRKSSHYWITFFYDRKGKIVAQEISYMVVIP